MINVIIIDDETNALDVLEMQLNNYCTDVNISCKCDGGEKGITAIKKYNPDLVFLDIEMPHKNGFDVLKETSQFNYEVVFTTAYDQFAIKAFKFSAIDYLLKPIDIIELQEAIEKVKTRKGSTNLDDKIQQLFAQFHQKNEKLTQKIAIPMGDGMELLEPNEIIRCESDSNYTHIFLLNGKKITLAKTLKDVEENIEGSPFYRIHQSHLINMNHVAKFMKGDGAYVIMKDGTQIAISRNKKEAFMETFRKL
jgi:two-component system, LytTR family, response regulator